MSTEYMKYLEFIQNIITRMNKNSFQLKQWMIAIVSALLALYASNKCILYIYIIIIPVIIFWGLDAYYLLQERRFRDLYNAVINLPDRDIKNREIKIFNMDIKKYKQRKRDYIDVLVSPTIYNLYLSIIIIINIIICLFYSNWLLIIPSIVIIICRVIYKTVG